MITVREELAQLNDMFKLLQEIHVEFQKPEQDNTKEQWYDDNIMVFSYKHKILNWLREGEKQSKLERYLRGNAKLIKKSHCTQLKKHLW